MADRLVAGPAAASQSPGHRVLLRRLVDFGLVTAGAPPAVPIMGTDSHGRSDTGEAMFSRTQRSVLTLNVQVLWGYGLFPDCPGDRVEKKMSLCSGAELITELCHQLRISHRQEELFAGANCIPCMMPLRRQPVHAAAAR